MVFGNFSMGIAFNKWLGGAWRTPGGIPVLTLATRSNVDGGNDTFMRGFG